MKDWISKFLRSYIRPYMPMICRRYYRGVKVRDYSLIDPILGAEQFFKQDYKVNLVDAVRNAVSKGDDVIVVGGGFGVSAVNAYNESKTGDVVVYECSEERIEECRSVFNENNAHVDLRQEAVGVVKKEIGNIEDSDFLDPASLPKCDVLEMDCEGAEVDILEEMVIRPSKIVVETHPRYDASTSKVVALLKDLRYSVVSKSEDSVAGHVLVAEKN